jgi:hypothetical protein
MSKTMNLLEAKALEGVARVHRAIWFFFWILDYPDLLFACCCPSRAQLCCEAEAQRSAAYRFGGRELYIYTNQCHEMS